MKKIIITGANGYIGSHVVKEMCNIAPNDHIIAIDFKNDKIDPRAHFLNNDILNNASSANQESLYDGSIDCCIHLAWQDGFNHNANSHIENLFKHYNFITRIIEAGCQNITVMGSMHEVGYHEGMVNEFTPCNPLSPYGISKNSLRQLIQAYINDKNISFKWLRAFYITGDDTNNKSIFSKIIQFENEQKTTFPFTDGKNKHDFIDIKDLAKQIAFAAIQNKTSGIINVCSGTATSLKDKVEEFIHTKKFKIRPEYGVFPTRKYDSPIIYGDNTKINEIMAEATQ